MEDFSHEVIANLKSAQSEEELIRVIGNSMFQLRKERKSFDDSKYILHMIACLSAAADTKDLSRGAAYNIKLAIAIFKQFQKNGREEFPN